MTEVLAQPEGLSTCSVLESTDSTNPNKSKNHDHLVSSWVSVKVEFNSDLTPEERQVLFMDFARDIESESSLVMTCATPIEFNTLVFATKCRKHNKEDRRMRINSVLGVICNFHRTRNESGKLANMKWTYNIVHTSSATNLEMDEFFTKIGYSRQANETKAIFLLKDKE